MALTTVELRDGALPETLPARADGTEYPFAMAWGDRAVLADSRTELTAQIIEGYADIPSGEEGDIDALYARYKTAVHFANNMQQIVAAHATEEGTFDPSVESEDVLTSIFTDRSQKIDEITEWNHTVPLVLVASEYAPYGTATRPGGNVQWLDPFTETTFLASLADTGIVELVCNEG